MMIRRKIKSVISLPLSKMGEEKPKTVSTEIVNATINAENETVELELLVTEHFNRKLTKKFGIGGTYIDVKRSEIIRWPWLRWISKRSWVGKMLPKVTLITSTTPISFDLISTEPEEELVGLDGFWKGILQR
jgi:hypothetical protein